GRSLARLDEGELATFRAREVALVFQGGNLWSELSARENVALGLRLGGSRQVRDAVERALEMFDLRNRGGTRAGALSGGEQQRPARLQAPPWRSIRRTAWRCAAAPARARRRCGAVSAGSASGARERSSGRGGDSRHSTPSPAVRCVPVESRTSSRPGVCCRIS